MYLTKLILNPLSSEVVRDLANPYEFHRTLLRAFPDQDEGGPGRVLYRVERTEAIDDQGEAPVVLVQSDHAPDWTRARVRPDYFRDRLPPKVIPTEFTVGARFRFRLRANPTVKREGKRHALYREEEQLQWLHRKAESAGFRVTAVTVAAEGNSVGSKRKGHHEITLAAARFDGELEVVDPALLKAALQVGIGSAKGFGFGMLSLARR